MRTGGRGRVGARRSRRRAADTLFQLGPCVACASCSRSRRRELSTDEPLTLTASAGRRPRRGCAQEQLRNAPSAHSPADRLGLGLIAPRRGARLGRARRRCTAARLAPWLPLSGVVQKASYLRPKNLPRLLSMPSEAARARRSRAPAFRVFGPPARERPAGRGSGEEQWAPLPGKAGG